MRSVTAIRQRYPGAVGERNAAAAAAAFGFVDAGKDELDHAAPD